MFFKQGPNLSGPPQPDLANLSVIDALPGDNLSIVAAGPDFSDLDFTVDRRDQL